MRGPLLSLLLWRTLVLTLALSASQANADQPSIWESRATQPVPAGAKVTLELDHPEYFLGENVLVHFTLQNIGDQPFQADFGGDYRGATRALRFKVTATDESGVVAPDPDPSGICFGGLGGPRTLKPGDKFTESLPLMRYCQITQPGRYTIRATHDFGWKEGERKRPVGEITVMFKMPTPTEAETLINTMEKMPADPNHVYGQRSHNYPDFTLLRQPVYLKPLLRRAEKGNHNALEGIAWIETVDATMALIELATNSDSKLALDSARTLTMRLPDPNLESTNGFGGFAPFTRETRRRLVKHSWDPKLAPEVRSLATNYLAQPSADEVAAGASMVQCVGTLAEAPNVIAAMDHALNPLVNPRQDPKDDILDQPQPLRELISAMDALHGKNYEVHEGALNGEAQILLYFHWLANQSPPRSDRWLETVKAFGPNSKFPTRVAALESIPEPLPVECIEFVKSRLSDPDLGVCRTACTVAGKSGDKTFLKPILEIIATEHHEWLLGEASEAAKKLGGGFALLDTWADRLTDEKLYGLALDSLQTVIEGLPGSSSGRTDLSRSERIALRNEWKSFLSKHADEIRAGKKFKVNDPALTPALFGRARSWQLPNGKPWPITEEEMNKPPDK
ncbi:HEAT repeat domain-containing protein [Pedosphaera parvula]|uniref:Uncharacterized protein n=1 Tax=Pedosphaera parvula (strain Ellin514) TaxID=320771 RepID=B9XRN9_PEDPL|nr:HEAT repeat domain-containing protein [Pedosphaera parvula]EEF57510.1 hypothetical protein Cflav_PD0441 [Pedosphaera parvula Ellin514]